MKIEVGQIYQVDGPNYTSLAEITNVYKHHIIYRYIKGELRVLGNQSFTLSKKDFINRFTYIKKYSTPLYKIINKA